MTGVQTCALPISDINGIYLLVTQKQPAKEIAWVSNYPNPFNPNKEKTTIRYTLKKASPVSIRIYDVFGNLVKEIKDPPGGYKGLNEVLWDGKNEKGVIVASGAYLCVIKAGDSKEIRKIGVVK